MGFADNPGHLLPGATAKIKPAAPSPDIGMTTVGCDLLAGNEEQLRAAMGRKVSVVAYSVVVGDGKKVEALAAGGSGEFRYAAVGVAVVGVSVQIAFEPSWTRASHEVKLLRRWGRLGRVPLFLGEEYLDSIRTARRGNLVQS